MFTSAQDTIDYIISFLDGKARSQLCCVNREFYNTASLHYDGPQTVPRKYIVFKLPEKYYDYGVRTKNSFYYSTCQFPNKSWSLWFHDLLVDPNVNTGTVICAWRFISKSICPVDDETFRDIAESLSSSIDNQTHKLIYLLEQYSVTTLTKDYLLRLSCMRANIKVITYLVEIQKSEVTATVIMAILISTEFEGNQRLEVLQYLLNHSNIVNVASELDYWNLKYTLHSNDWEAFTVIYKALVLFLRNEFITWREIEHQLCYALPESRQLTAYNDIVNLRRSLNTPV